MKRATRFVVCGTVLGAVLASLYAWANSSGSFTCTVSDPGIAMAHGLVSSGSGNFALTAPASYVPGESVPITLSGQVGFKGILIYALDGSSNRVGVWQIGSGYQAMTICGSVAANQATMTHTSNTVKSVPVVFNWTAPAALTGTVTFKALVMPSMFSYFNVSGLQIAESIFDNGFEASL